MRLIFFCWLSAAHGEPTHLGQIRIPDSGVNRRNKPPPPHKTIIFCDSITSSASVRWPRLACLATSVYQSKQRLRIGSPPWTLQCRVHRKWNPSLIIIPSATRELQYSQERFSHWKPFNGLPPERIWIPEAPSRESIVRSYLPEANTQGSDQLKFDKIEHYSILIQLHIHLF